MPLTISLDYVASCGRRIASTSAKMLHATDFVGDRGRISPAFVPKGARARIFDFVLSGISLLPDARLIHGITPSGDEERLFDFLLNRIHTNMRYSGSHAIIISDEGKNYDAMLRRMRRVNYIPSKYGAWYSGDSAKNIPVDRIIEDITYRDSRRSLFIQAADFCAYALLRSERPVASKTKLGLDQSLLILEPIMVKAANRSDTRRLGIVRA